MYRGDTLTTSVYVVLLKGNTLETLAHYEKTEIISAILEDKGKFDKNKFSYSEEFWLALESFVFWRHLTKTRTTMLL